MDCGAIEAVGASKIFRRCFSFPRLHSLSVHQLQNSVREICQARLCVRKASMESLTAYLDHAKTVTQTSSDSNMARKIGVSRNALCEWRKGRNFPSDETMIALAERANLDPAEALALLGLWRSHGETKAAYARLLKLSRMAKFSFPYMILGALAYYANGSQDAVLSAFLAVSYRPDTSQFNHYANFIETAMLYGPILATLSLCCTVLIFAALKALRPATR